MLCVAGLLGAAVCLAAALKSALPVKAAADALSVDAESGLLMDAQSGTVVFEQNARKRLPIASMVKIMTLLITFEEIENGKMNVDADIVASETAASMGGSQAFLDANAAYKTGELIKSIIVASANDSCVAVAEAVCGSVSGFVDRMNEKAAALALADTRFVNCTGLPAPDQYSCAYDVGVMSREMLKHPLFFDYSAIWMFDFKHPSGRVTALTNTNKLIRAYEGCDGGKTGFTNEAKYCLSATAKRGATRLISVVMGAESSKIRNAQNAKLFNYGFANYETRRLVENGVGSGADHAVLRGKQATVKGVPASDLSVFVKKNTPAELSISEDVGELTAPVAEGQVIGKLRVFLGGEPVGEADLIAANAVGRLTYLDIVDGFIDKW
jgi:D-alanyl-D-alanine carboxypeptidase (penicillin-binding protein 5/6)